MKKLIAIIFAIVLTFSLTACGSGSKEITIAVPNDASNEARALQLLEKLGYIKLKSGVENVTPLDITENPFNIKIQEIEAAQIPNVLKDVDFGIVNGNYALSSGLLPATKALAVEGTEVAKPNIIAVKEGNENTEKIRALVAAVESQQVADFIKATYGDAVISVVENPGDGFDPDIDYTKLAGETISVAASPVPHCEILKIAADILAQKGITLDIKEFTDYVQPNNVVESGEVDANYFQHIPYLEDFNAQNGTHIVSVTLIHYEPMGLFAGKQSSLDIFK